VRDHPGDINLTREFIMAGTSFSVADEVFARFPDYVRGVVVAHAVTNGPTPPALLAQLRAAEASVRSRLTLETLTAEPRIAAWREAFRKSGIKPSEFRASVEAMGRRALREQELPAINTLVDIGNILSLRHLVPVGGHAIDHVTQSLALRFATGAEQFEPFGTTQVEQPDPGEIIFVEGNTVLTRRWSWRQANHTLTLPTTTAVEINVDGLPPVSLAAVEAICQEAVEMVRQYCGGRVWYAVLTRQKPQITLDHTPAGARIG
jgi:DNA/RNA-binding domain of Phe-tRNA-synthetase-like protein